jgi:hypothetical protein
VSCGAPKFQFTPLRFFKPNLSAPKAPLCTPVSCTKNLLEPAYLDRANAAKRAPLAVTIDQYSLPASVRRPITDERRPCQVDPLSFGLLRRSPDIRLKYLLQRMASSFARQAALRRDFGRV